MKRSEYMSELSKALEIFGDDVKSEIIEDYNEHYEIGLQNGKTEDQISEELGDIEELVKELKKSENFEKKEKQQEEQDFLVNEKKDSKENNYNDIGNENKQAGPRKIEVRSKFAHVEIITSQDNQIHLDWTNYSQSRARDYYDFQSWLEGTTIYGELCRKNIGSIFTPMFNGDVHILVQIPQGFPEVEIHSMSGDTVMHDVTLQSSKITSASGDIQVERCNTSSLSLDTKSGGIICKEATCPNLNMDTKSGKIEFFNINSSSIYARSLSGKLRGNNLSGSANVSAVSGDIEIANVDGAQFDVSTISGEIEIKHLQGDALRINSKSGDIEAEICVGEIIATSISGDVELTNAREANYQASSVSGDVEITCNQCAGYVADVSSVSGKAYLTYGNIENKKRGKGVYTYGAGTTKINAKTTSGDIKIRA